MLPIAANLQKIRNGIKTYAITPHIPGGLVKPDTLRKFADVAEKYNAVLKLTSAQRIMITNLNAEDVANVWTDLAMEPAVGYANCVRSVKICPGITFCKRGKQDSIKLGLELDRRYIKKEMPSRIKFGVAGCPNSCAEIHVKDIGILGTDNGWDIYVGGTAGAHPRLANKLIEGLEYDETLAYVDTILKYYQQYANVERIGQFIDRIGWEKFQKEISALACKDKNSVLENETEKNTKLKPIPGGLTMGSLVFGDYITPESVISDIIRIYPKTIPVFRSFGMGCLGCPSAASEPLTKAVEIHGISLDELLSELNKIVGEELKDE